MSFIEKIDKTKLPEHVAIIMDGNGRWAKGLGKLRVFGHQNGVHAVREALQACVEVGVKHLTLYAFSSENWNRPKFEVKALMELLVHSLAKELPTFQKHGIRVNTIGNLDDLPSNGQKKLRETKELTKNNSSCVLTLALSYGAKAEIAQATKTICELVAQGEIKTEDINESLIHKHLYTSDLPDPDLMIRTGGELRLSNFLLYQMAYTELCFLDKMWPEFKKEDLYEAIYNFQKTERRFGKTSEQL